MKRRHILIAAISTLLLFAAVVWSFRAPLSMMLMKQVATYRFSANPLATLPDGLHVGLCGAGSPLPDERRSAPCTVVIAGKRMFMIDAGAAAARNLARMGFNPGDLDTLFLTHFHSDHIDGIGELLLQRWAGGSHDAPLPVVGPSGVAQVIEGIMQTYTQDRQYRIDHHGPAVVPPDGFGAQALSFEAPPPDGRVVLVDEPDLQIVAFSVSHAPVQPAVGYRIRYKDRTAVFSGDTSKARSVQREAKGVDLLVHEALAPKLVEVLADAATAAGRNGLAKIFRDIPEYHTTPQQAAEIAHDAGVGALLLNHIVPPLPQPGMQAAFLGNAQTFYDGPIKVGIDGDFVSLPAASKAIVFGRLP